MKGRSREAEVEQQSAALLEDVVSGRVALMFPPGTLASAAFVPLACASAVALGFSISAVSLPSGTAADDLAPVLLPMAIAAALGAVAAVIQGAIALGVHVACRAARFYGFISLLASVAVSALHLVSGSDAPLGMLLAAPLASALCYLVTGSRPYLACASFLSLKRAYRRDPQGTLERIRNAARRP